MAEIDNTLALKVNPPESFGKQLETFGNFQNIYMKNQQIRGLQDYARDLDKGVAPEVAVRHVMRVNPEMGHKILEGVQKGRDVDALGHYKHSGNLDDLRGASPELQGQAAAADTATQGAHGKWLSQRAQQIQGTSDPGEKLKLWQETGDEASRRGLLHPDQWGRIRPQVNDEVLDTIIRRSLPVPEYRNTTGLTQGAAAAAQAPYQLHSGSPTDRVTTPLVQPGGPAEGANPAPVGTTAPPLPPTRPLNTRPATAEEANDADRANPYWKEVPDAKLVPPVQGGPGVIQKGQHPIEKAGIENAVARLEKDIQPNATAAQKTNASLNTMESELKGGKVATDRLAELKLTVAGFINAAMGETDGKTAKSILGLDLPWAEAFAKESTRMGLQYARQTEGAREAVQAIRIALAANPSLLNSQEGNLKIIKTMKAANDYDIERGKAASAYFRKNNNLADFDTWFSNAHPPSQFISKAVPYSFNASTEPQAGITYEIPTGATSKDGKPVTMKGTWNAETGHFDPVR